MQNNNENQNVEKKEQNVPESIWAPGIPENIQESDKIDIDMLVAMATDYLMKNFIIPRGFKVDDGFPRKEIPNIVMKMDGKTYAVVICPSIYPHYRVVSNELRLQLVKLCKERDIIPLMAPVGYMSIDDERAKAAIALRGDVFKTTFPGFLILTDEENQDMALKPNTIFRP